MNLFLKVFLFLTIGFTFTAASTFDLMEKIDDLIGGNINMAPKIVRLAFHDCAGGCDGCINMRQAGNKGLDEPIYALEKIHKELGYKWSRADLWANAAIQAIMYLVRLNQNGCYDCELPPIYFYTQRKDCDTSPDRAEYDNLPKTSWGLQETLDYFEKNFGFLEWETVALLGAHTLGGAEIQNSGFAGSFVYRGETYFDNTYYKNLLNKPWRKTTMPGQWNSDDGDMMLNNDICLVKFPFDGYFWEQLPFAKTKNSVIAYACSNRDWYLDFFKAFDHMEQKTNRTVT